MKGQLEGPRQETPGRRIFASLGFRESRVKEVCGLGVSGFRKFEVQGFARGFLGQS